MPQTTVNDISLYYEQHGAGEDLVLIGGLGADHQVWKSTLRHFSKHYRVLTLDNRGAGQSSAPDFPYTTEMMANDILQLMDALHISRAHILGHSMGGRIAQQIALIAPEKVNQLIIACSHAKSSAVSTMILSMREKLQAADVSKELLAEYTMPFLFGETFLKNTVQVKGFIQWTLQNPRPQSAIGYKNQLLAVKSHDLTHRLNQITAPTLIIAGNEDILAPAASLQSMANSMKNSVFKSIADCAHMPHVEKPHAFFDIVLRFLDLSLK
jgi:3-oxoadipate enol-lactonase